MSAAGRRRVTLLLLFALVLQALVAATVLLRPAPAVQTGPGDAAAALPDLPAMAALDSFAETVNRPLFLATRRDLPDAAAAPGRDENLILGRYAFVGAVAAPGRSLVLLAPADGGPTLRLREGEVLDGFKVQEIGVDFLRLERDGSETLVPLVKR